jgi:hypothetical protein
MKTMNIKSTLVTLLIAAFTFASCSKKKDEVAPPPSPVVGVWEGKWGSGNDVPDNYFSFTITNDGKLTVSEGLTKRPGTGTWTLDGSTFKAIYSYNDDTDKFNVAAKLNDAGILLSGSWGDGEVSAGEGEFYMNKLP